MKNKYLYIETFGCQMNVHDSEQMAALLANCGYKLTEHCHQADLILFNTCSIREKAEQKAFSQLGRLITLKKRNPRLIVGFGGCLAQHLGAHVYERCGDVDFVFGTHNIHLLPEMVSAVEEKRKRITRIDFHPVVHSVGIFAPPPRGAVSAFVTIMQGCNNFCAYCVVPYLRGPEISRSPEDIIEEIFGEIDDEYDKESKTEKQISDNEFIFSGRLEIDYLNEKYTLNLPESDDYETLAGLVLHYHEDIPKKDEKIEIENFSFTILQASHTRIEQVRLEITDQS